MWLNHDHDLVDVGLRDTTTTSTTSTTTPTTAASRTSGTPVSSSTHTTARPTQGAARLSRTLRGVSAAIAVALAITLGNAAPAQAATATATTTTTTLSSPTPTETIHTTANHPWLTADRGWVEAGELQPGEAVVTLSGTTATVAWVQTVAGQADMYNLTVASDHTYAVGDGGVVVHNVCEDLIDTAEEAATDSGRRVATSIRVEDAEGNSVTLPQTTFTSDTAVDEGPFEDIIRQERAYGTEHAGGRGERFACGALYEHRDEISGGYVEMGLWHRNGEGPCAACQRILQRTANELSITFT